MRLTDDRLQEKSKLKLEMQKHIKQYEIHTFTSLSNWEKVGNVMHYLSNATH